MRLNIQILLYTIGYKKLRSVCGDFESFYIPQETLVYFDTYWADFYKTKPELRNPNGLPVYQYDEIFSSEIIS